MLGAFAALTTAGDAGAVGAAVSVSAGGLDELASAAEREPAVPADGSSLGFPRIALTTRASREMISMRPMKATTPISSLFFGCRPALISLRSSKIAVSCGRRRGRRPASSSSAASVSTSPGSPPRSTGSVGGGRFASPRAWMVAVPALGASSRSMEPLSSSIIGSIAARCASTMAISSGGGGRPTVVGNVEFMGCASCGPVLVAGRRPELGPAGGIEFGLTATGT